MHMLRTSLLKPIFKNTFLIRRTLNMLKLFFLTHGNSPRTLFLSELHYAKKQLSVRKKRGKFSRKTRQKEKLQLKRKL